MGLAPDQKRSYIPTLDGWRAIAILAVLGYHTPVLHLGPLSTQIVHDYGSQGVDLFFAISGLLICSRLLAEEKTSGTISLRSFYIRRVFRILPAAVVYLLAAGALGLLHVIPMPIGAWLSALFSVRNYYGAISTQANTWYTGHFWSLAVEEHFYLLLPGLLVVFAKRRTLVLGILILCFTVWQAIFLNGWPQRTDLRIDALLIPAFLAVLLQSERVVTWFRKWLHPLVAIILLAMVLVVIAKGGRPLEAIKPLLKVTYPLLILSTVLHPKGWMGWVLELAPLRWVGHISYSIYLWQQLFFLDVREMHDSHAGWPVGGLQHLPFNLIAVFAMATLSYYFVEKPLVRLGHRLTHKRIPERGEKHGTEPDGVKALV
jgi:peptidoglycan/LPS O-acetylase OafA/YrhL